MLIKFRIQIYISVLSVKTNYPSYNRDIKLSRKLQLRYAIITKEHLTSLA